MNTRLTERNPRGDAYYVACFSDKALCGGGNPGEACNGCEDFMENYPHAILDEFGYPNDTCPAALLGASCPYTDKPTCMRCPMWDKPAK